MTIAVVPIVFSIVALVLAVAVLVTAIRSGKRKEDAGQFLWEIQRHRILTMIDHLERAGRLHEVTKDRSLEEVYLDYLREQAPDWDFSGIIAGSQPGTIYIPRRRETDGDDIL